MSRWVGPTVAVALAVGVGVVTLVGGGNDTDSADDGREPVAVAAAPAERFATVEALVGASDLVVRGTVAEVTRGRVVGTPGGGSVESRVVGIEVVEVLAGGPAGGGTVLVEEEGFLADGTPIAVNGVRPPAVGDDGVWFLQRLDDPDLPVHVATGTQGRYVIGPDGDVDGSEPGDPLVDRLAAGGLDALTAMVRTAAPR